jgi:hypothetical protein
MMMPRPSIRIYLCLHPADMRKSHVGPPVSLLQSMAKPAEYSILGYKQLRGLVQTIGRGNFLFSQAKGGSGRDQRVCFPAAFGWFPTQSCVVKCVGITENHLSFKECIYTL